MIERIASFLMGIFNPPEVEVVRPGTRILFSGQPAIYTRVIEVVDELD